MYEVYTAPQSGHFIDTVSVLGLGGLGGWFAGGAGARRTRLGLIVRVAGFIRAVFGILRVDGMYFFPPQPGGAAVDAWVVFCLRCTRAFLLPRAGVSRPRARGGLGTARLQYLDGQGWGYNVMVSSCQQLGILSRYLRAWVLKS